MTRQNWLRAQYPIDPKSTAGILLLEFDSPQQAFNYASKRVRTLDAMGQSHSAMRWDYFDAAQIIQEHYL